MLQELMPNATLVAEDIPVHPEEGIEMLQKMAETESLTSSSVPRWEACIPNC